ncbi:hypothetical protein QUB68_16520 [Microcoleus sp. A006_D1]|uniref:hypothetical protein n=1 Tax=Microcoleus sp. A006_D1 TaxID=3055267 RepID=UPI002FD0D68E
MVNKRAIALSSKSAIGLSPIRVHPRVSAVQKYARAQLSRRESPFRQKERSPL